MTLRLKLNAAAIAKLSETVSRGPELAAEYVLQVSNTRVPLEEGTLMRSGRVTTDDDEAAVSYDTKYAVRQHEELHYRHDQGRQAKYLESAINDSQEKILRIMASETKKAIG